MGRHGGNSPPQHKLESRGYTVTALQNKVDNRLLREDHLRVKHDKLFSDWKILVGQEDWTDHATGKEGSQKYRLHNLPVTYFGPGVYELGLTVQQPQTCLSAADGQDTKRQYRKIRNHAVVVVYLGQAYNIRQRLQRYGQTGSHLEGNRSGLVDTMIDEADQPSQNATTGQSLDLPAAKLTTLIEPRQSAATIQTGLRLFTEVFSRGFSIAFRWAKTETKHVAERVESELLHVFDYSWNSSLNGARRPSDILTKLELWRFHLKSSDKLCLGRAFGGNGWRHWEKHIGRKVGISVSARKPQDKTEALSAKFASPKANRAPHVCIEHHGGGKAEEIARNCPAVCGVLMTDGSICKCPPATGRRRCAAHKGLRAPLENTCKEQICASGAHDRGSYTTPPITTIRTQRQGKRVGINISQTCGVYADGEQQHCPRSPAPGRRRCELHKGMHLTTTEKRVEVRKVNRGSERTTVATRTIIRNSLVVDLE